jgi:hypothetical protein
LRYSANAIINFISSPENGFKIDGGIPKCPKESDCLDSEGNSHIPRVVIKQSDFSGRKAKNTTTDISG